ncbi:MAG: hypothetical protein KME30_25275 [Iphinoe sp. HA4291-MV1]|nr:hypothetical protein [Iphinoe sp. HA4291-MV1]
MLERLNGKSQIAIAIAYMSGIGTLSFFMLIVIFGANSSLNRFVKGMTLVQLEDGRTITTKAVSPNERTDSTIKKFVSDSMVKMFNWDGVIQSTESSVGSEIITKPDKGVDIQILNGATRKIPTEVWEAAFALSENQDFRANFLKKLAQMVPDGIFTGSVRVSLVPRYFSSPRKISEGKWEVDMVATLVSFDASNNTGRGITFNKTITVQAVWIPQVPPDTTELAKHIYNARLSGLEITQMVDLNLGKK